MALYCLTTQKSKMKKKIILDNLEFYINHTCNFNCSGCNRFNNYKFKGLQAWDEYENVHRAWAEKVDLKNYSILGGEPLLNPDIIKWIRGIRELWPDSSANITTNGSIHKRFDKELYNALLETKTAVSIGLHNIDRMKEVLDLLEQFLVHPLIVEQFPKNLNDLSNFKNNWKISYNNIRSKSWPDCNSVEDWDALPEYIKKECTDIHHFSPKHLIEERSGYKIIDDNGLTVLVEHENFFHQGALIQQEEHNTFTLHNSDPKKAHSVCHSKLCHHMMYGKISKCGQSVLFKEFSKQFVVDIPDNDLDLIMGYKPCSVDDDIENFVKNLGNPIPQCKFCPEKYVSQEIKSRVTRDNFGKRVKLIRY
jgi:organic radical activating enzyme